MAKTGRPRKDPRQRITQFGMTASELEALSKIAEKRDRSLSHVVRAIGTAAMEDPVFLDQAIARLDSAGGAEMPPDTGPADPPT